MRGQPRPLGAAGRARPRALSRAGCRSSCSAARRSRRSAIRRTCSRCRATASTGSASPTDVEVPNWHEERLAPEDLPVLVLFDGWTSFFRDRVVPWRIGMAEKLREQLEAEVLPRYLAAQRWYAAKGEQRSSARARRPRAVGGARRELAARAARGRGRRRAGALLPAARARLGGRDEAAPAARSRRRRWPVRQQAQRRRAWRRVRRRGVLPRGRRARSARTRVPDRARRPCASRRPRRSRAIAGSDFGRRCRSGGRRRRAATPWSRSASACSSKGYRRLRAGRQPGARGGAVPDRGRALRALRPGRGRDRVPRRRRDADDARAAAGLRREPGRRLDRTRSTTSSASSRPSVRRPESPPGDVHGGFLALCRRSGRGRRSCTRRSRCRTGDPAFDPEPVTGEDLAAWKARVRDEARATLDLLRAPARGAAAGRARGGAGGARRRAPCARRSTPPARRRRGSLQDALPRRLSPRPGAGREQRLRDHRLRGRAGAAARRAAREAFAAARRRRHAALVRLRARDRARARRAQRRGRRAARAARGRLGGRGAPRVPRAPTTRRRAPRPLRRARRGARPASSCSSWRRRSTSCATRSTTAPPGCGSRSQGSSRLRAAPPGRPGVDERRLRWKSSTC